jgi:hypothetical protein
MPGRYRGTAKESLWRAFKSGAPMPLGERRLRSILAGCPGTERAPPGALLSPPRTPPGPAPAKHNDNVLDKAGPAAYK